MINQRGIFMKKNSFILIVLCLALTGCYLIPVEIPTQVPGTSTTIPTLVDTEPADTHTAVPTITETSTASSTATKTQAPSATYTPSKTSTLTLTPSKTFTATLTQTPTKTRTATPTKTAAPTKTATLTKTATSTPYTLQADTPVYIENFAHTDAGCNWMGVAGQVFGADDEPVINLVVIAKGTINGSTVDITSVTGVVKAEVYGPGGYEIVLGDSAAATSQSLSIQVFDLSGNALSEEVFFDTYANCDKNLVVINFTAQ